MSMKLKPMTKNQIKEATGLIAKGKILPNCQTVLKGERKSLLTAAQKQRGKEVFTKLCQFSCTNNLPFQQVEIPKTPLKTFTVSSTGLFAVNNEGSTPINPTTGGGAPPPPPIAGGIVAPEGGPGPNGGPGHGGPGQGGPGQGGPGGPGQDHGPNGGQNGGPNRGGPAGPGQNQGPPAGQDHGPNPTPAPAPQNGAGFGNGAGAPLPLPSQGKPGSTVGGVGRR